MAEWTHRICERCYYDSEFGILKEGEHEGAYRMPVQIRDPDPGACCFCGGFVALTGIYVRKDERELRCQGRHEDLSSWSRVQVG